MDSEQKSKASPERQVYLIPFHLPLLFGFFSCQVSAGRFQSSCAFLKILEKVKQILH